MNVPGKEPSVRSASELSKHRLLTTPDDPWLLADWHRALFLHYRIAPEVLRPYVPAELGLELYADSAWVSVVAVTLDHFRPAKDGTINSWLMRPIAKQCLLNLRTYVRHRDEPGAYFLWMWASRPLGLPIPFRVPGIPSSLARIRYDHWHETRLLTGSVSTFGNEFAYRAELDADHTFEPCPRDSLAEFTLERYTGFVWVRQTRLLRVWHEPWTIAPATVSVGNETLIRRVCPWFSRATLVAAHYSPGAVGAWMGRLHNLPKNEALL